MYGAGAGQKMPYVHSKVSKPKNFKEQQTKFGKVEKQLAVPTMQYYFAFLQGNLAILAPFFTLQAIIG